MASLAAHSAHAQQLLPVGARGGASVTHEDRSNASKSPVVVNTDVVKDVLPTLSTASVEEQPQNAPLIYHVAANGAIPSQVSFSLKLPAGVSLSPSSLSAYPPPCSDMTVYTRTERLMQQ